MNTVALALSHVRPSPALSYKRDRCHGKAEVVRDQAQRATCSSDEANLLVRKFRRGVVFSARKPLGMSSRTISGSTRRAPRLSLKTMPIPGGLSPLGDHVETVFGPRSEKQMARVHAVAHVAAMQDAEAGWYWPTKEIPGNAMSSPGRSRRAKLAVSVWIPACGPLPATIRDNCLRHKAGEELAVCARERGRICVSHVSPPRKDSRVRLGVGAATPRRADSIRAVAV